MTERMAAAASLDLLAKVALDAYLLARYGSPGGRMPDGRSWERAVAELLWRPGLSRRQSAGGVDLLGRGSGSGCRHEIDACASGWAGHLTLECKAKIGGIHKGDVAVFVMKTMDFYCGNIETAQSERWWRMMVSAGDTERNVRALCMKEGIILCDSGRLPLSVLLRAASRPIADQYLSEVEMGELVRLGERVLQPMQDLWRLRTDGDVSFRPALLKAGELDDLVWLQDELSERLLDLYDKHTPGRLEQRAWDLGERLRTISRLDGRSLTSTG